MVQELIFVLCVIDVAIAFSAKSAKMTRVILRLS